MKQASRSRRGAAGSGHGSTGRLVVYTPAGRERTSPGAVLRELRRAAEIGWRLFRRDLKAQYRQSLFGILLALTPAVAIALWATMASEARIISVGSLDMPYPAYVLFSMVVWQGFSEALRLQIEGLEAERSILAKLDVPAESVILARAGEALFNLLVKLAFVVVVFAWLSVQLRWTLLLLPAAIAPLFALGTGLGLLLAPLNALYRDVSRALPAVLTFWFFLTPVVFPVPEQGILRFFVRSNPVTPLLVAARDLSVLGRFPGPEPALALVASVSGLAVLAGWMFYRTALPIVLERSP